MNEIIYIKRFISLYWHFIGVVEAMHEKAVRENHQYGIDLTKRKLDRLKIDLLGWQDKLMNEVKHER